MKVRLEQPPFFPYLNDANIMPISRNLRKKRSTPASLSFKGQATKPITVKCYVLSAFITTLDTPRASARQHQQKLQQHNLVRDSCMVPSDRQDQRFINQHSRAFETVLTIHEHQCASANIVDNSLKNVYRNVSIYRKCII